MFSSKGITIIIGLDHVEVRIPLLKEIAAYHNESIIICYVQAIPIIVARATIQFCP